MPSPSVPVASPMARKRSRRGAPKRKAIRLENAAASTSAVATSVTSIKCLVHPVRVPRVDAMKSKSYSCLKAQCGEDKASARQMHGAESQFSATDCRQTNARPRPGADRIAGRSRMVKASGDSLAEGDGGVGHAVREAPFIVVPGQHRHEIAVHHLGLVERDDRGMRVVVEVDRHVRMMGEGEDALQLALRMRRSAPR